MMKRKIILLLSLISTGLLGAACSDDKVDNIPPQAKAPLMAFSVAVKNLQTDKTSYYHGKINEATHQVEIGVIDNPNVITGVEYTLMSDGATISPNPATFIQNWKKEQTLTVTTEDSKQTTYTIVFTKYDDALEDVLFMDEFNTDGIPDPNKWVLCKKETSDWNDEMSESYDQAYCQGGSLILKAEKVNDEYKAGGIETQGKFDMTFGIVEVRARVLTYPNGAFPAIWMMPKSAVYGGWPRSGEIDIMEHIKQEPSIHQTLHTHYIDDLGNKENYTKQTNCDFGNWTIYSVKKEKDKITFYINGMETFSYSNLNLDGNDESLPDDQKIIQWPFTDKNPFYLILNMGLGGDRDGSWAGPIDDTNLPAVMEVDWVKVKKLKD